MALMFPRLARNFARNGYYPTDETTLERTCRHWPPPTGKMRICDPCAGEGVALAEAAHFLGRDRTDTFAVEYDQERAAHCRTLLDRVLHSDLMDTMISRQAFGLLWLNLPYGDLVADHAGASQYQGSGRRRLEKMFYQRALPLLQYGGCWCSSFHTMCWTTNSAVGYAITSLNCGFTMPLIQPSNRW